MAVNEAWDELQRARQGVLTWLARLSVKADMPQHINATLLSAMLFSEGMAPTVISVINGSFEQNLTARGEPFLDDLRAIGADVDKHSGIAVMRTLLDALELNPDNYQLHTDHDIMRVFDRYYPILESSQWQPVADLVVHGFVFLAEWDAFLWALRRQMVKEKREAVVHTCVCMFISLSQTLTLVAQM